MQDYSDMIKGANKMLNNMAEMHRLSGRYRDVIASYDDWQGVSGNNLRNQFDVLSDNIKMVNPSLEKLVLFLTAFEKYENDKVDMKNKKDILNNTSEDNPNYLKVKLEFNKSFNICQTSLEQVNRLYNDLSTNVNSIN